MTQHDDLADLAPAREMVVLGGKERSVQGLTLQDFIALLVNNPDMKGIFAGELLVAAPRLLAKVAAAGLGRANDAKIENTLMTLAGGELIEAAAVTVKLTLPRGFGPLADALRHLGLGEIIDEMSSSFSDVTASLRSKSQKADEKAAA